MVRERWNSEKRVLLYHSGAEMRLKTPLKVPSIVLPCCRWAQGRGGCQVQRNFAAAKRERKMGITFSR